ncbi:MAG TPA: DinB family protein [Balneolaceae bacterium]|nr:DinB family protein [Balneolaceae bacterium]
MKNYLLKQYNLHHKLYNNVLDGFTDKETNRRLHGDQKMNHVKYLAGHLLNTQYGIGLVAEIEIPVKWNDLFAAAGQSEAKDTIEYPSIEEIRAEWNSIHKPIQNGLKKVTAGTLKKVPPKPFDALWDSLGEQWTFLNHHQAYHIGQIGILRRGFGKTPMSYE